MKAKELRGLSLEDLTKKVSELHEELFNTRLQNVTGALENNAKIRVVRRDLARVKTLIQEKEAAK